MTALIDRPDVEGGEAAPQRRIQLSQYGLAAVLIVLCVVASLSSDAFLTRSNLVNVLTQSSVIGILTIGMTFVILTGGIDLSVGSALAAASIYLGLQQDSGGIVMILAALFGGIVLGAVNGLAVTWGRVVPFIATLAMFSSARGLALLMSDNTPIAITNDTITTLGTKRILGVPLPVYVFALVAIVAWVVLNRTAFGRHVVAVGGNAEAARASGIRVEWVKFSVYVISGLCVGIGAILVTGRLGSASPVIGNLYELDAIAAAVIGGAALSGGKGGIGGSVLGVLLFQVIFNLFNLLDVNTNLQGVLKGLIILAAVVLQRRTRKV
ncbi:MAG TPA: ABC transporter permease [Mycobacteriales bacterium]|nr:ABC transporter permease [Mycobacteriales bacterium]